MSNLLGDYFRMQWLDVFIFGCDVHGSNAEFVNIFITDVSTFCGECDQVLVKDLLCYKVCPGAAIERRTDLDHPIRHFGPVVFCHFMPVEGTPLYQAFVNRQLHLVQDFLLLKGEM